MARKAPSDLGTAVIQINGYEKQENKGWLRNIVQSVKIMDASWFRYSHSC